MPEPMFMLKDGQEPVEIAGVGLLEKAGITLERAAMRMPELQDEHGLALEGQKLRDAAKAWADRVGLALSEPASSNAPAPEAAGSPPPAPPKEATPAPAPATSSTSFGSKPAADAE